MKLPGRIAAILGLAAIGTVGISVAVGEAIASASDQSDEAIASSSDDAAVSPSAPGAGSGQPGTAGRRQGRFGGFDLGRLGTHVYGETVLQTPAGDDIPVVRVTGTFQSVSPTSVTVKSADGYTLTFPIGQNTRIRNNGSPADASSLTTGDKGIAIGVRTGSTIDTKAIIANTEERTDHPGPSGRAETRDAQDT